MFSKDNDEVQDLFQDILTNLWTGFDSFRGEAQQKSWVWRVALNTCISVERKKKKRPQSAQLSMDIDLYADDDNDILQVQALTSASTPWGSLTVPSYCFGWRT